MGSSGDASWLSPLLVSSGVGFLGLALLIRLFAPVYHVVIISSTNGQTNAMESKDLILIDEIVTALNSAIVRRG
jgi:hypothetical protein